MPGLGLFGAAGHFLLIVAHKFAPPPAPTPFSYPQLVWMTASGWLKRRLKERARVRSALASRRFGPVPGCKITGIGPIAAPPGRSSHRRNAPGATVLEASCSSTPRRSPATRQRSAARGKSLRRDLSVQRWRLTGRDSEGRRLGDAKLGRDLRSIGARAFLSASTIWDGAATGETASSSWLPLLDLNRAIPINLPNRQAASDHPPRSS